VLTRDETGYYSALRTLTAGGVAVCAKGVEPRHTPYALATPCSGEHCTQCRLLHTHLHAVLW
jgi:hypothetical protein